MDPSAGNVLWRDSSLHTKVKGASASVGLFLFLSPSASYAREEIKNKTTSSSRRSSLSSSALFQGASIVTSADGKSAHSSNNIDTCNERHIHKRVVAKQIFFKVGLIFFTQRRQSPYNKNIFPTSLDTTFSQLAAARKISIGLFLQR